MTIKELRTKFDELIERHGSNIEDIDIWGSTEDAGFKFPVISVNVDKRRNRIVLGDC